MSTEPKSTARRDKTDEWDFRKPVTEPKLGTCDHPHRSARFLHVQATDCVNWREGESAAAQPEQPEEYFLKGGGGFEGTKEASKFSFAGMCDMAASYAEYRVADAESRMENRMKAVPPAAAQPCGEYVTHVIAGASWINCALPKGHKMKGHRGKGTCVKHGEYFGEVGAFPQCPKWPDCIVVPPAAETAEQDKCAKCGCNKSAHEVEIDRSGTLSGYCYAHPQDCPSFETSTAETAMTAEQFADQLENTLHDLAGTTFDLLMHEAIKHKFEQCAMYVREAAQHNEANLREAVRRKQVKDSIIRELRRKLAELEKALCEIGNAVGAPITDYASASVKCVELNAINEKASTLIAAALASLRAESKEPVD